MPKLEGVFGDLCERTLKDRVQHLKIEIGGNIGMSVPTSPRKFSFCTTTKYLQNCMEIRSYENRKKMSILHNYIDGTYKFHRAYRVNNSNRSSQYEEVKIGKMILF